MRQLLSLVTLTQHDRLRRKNVCYILQVAGNRLPVYLKATCRMYSYHAIYSRAACTDDHVALCMGCLNNTTYMTVHACTKEAFTCSKISN